MRQKITWVFVLILVLPIFSSEFDVLPNVSAVTQCEGEMPAVRWNETVSRLALTPINSYNYWNEFDEEPKRRGGGSSNQENTISAQEESMNEVNISEVPEESWMFFNDQWTLEPLKENIRGTMLIGNNSAGIYVVNLSSNYRTTVCVTLQGLRDGNYVDANGDVYLMTESEYYRYSESYSRSLYILDRDDETLSDIPPEWRSFDVLGWDTYRDSHQYENISEITFSVSLDGPEVYATLWGESNWEQFYIVIDAWDNDHSGDASPNDFVTVADVSVIVSERGTVLPNWTVSISCMVLLIGTLITPVIMNRKYMSSGLESAMSINYNSDLVPNLENYGEES